MTTPKELGIRIATGATIAASGGLADGVPLNHPSPSTPDSAHHQVLSNNPLQSYPLTDYRSNRPGVAEAAGITALDVAGGALITDTEKIRDNGAGFFQIQRVNNPDGSLKVVFFLKENTLYRSAVQNGQLAALRPTLTEIPINNVAISSDQTGNRILAAGNSSGDVKVVLSKDGGNSWTEVKLKDGQQQGGVGGALFDKNSGKWLIIHSGYWSEPSVYTTDGTSLVPMQYNGAFQYFSFASESSANILGAGSIRADGEVRPTGLTIYKPDFTNNTMTSENFNTILVDGTSQYLEKISAATLCPDNRTIIAAQQEGGNLWVFDRYTRSGYAVKVSDLLNNLGIPGLVTYNSQETMVIKAIIPEMKDGKIRLTFATKYRRKLANGEMDVFGGVGQLIVDPKNPDPAATRASFVHQPFSSDIAGVVAGQKDMQMAKIAGRTVVIYRALYSGRNGVVFLTMLDPNGNLDPTTEPAVIGEIGGKISRVGLPVVLDATTNLPTKG